MNRRLPELQQQSANAKNTALVDSFEVSSLSRVHKWVIWAIGAMIFAAVWFDYFVSPVVIQIGSFNLNVPDPVFVLTILASILAFVTHPVLSRGWVVLALPLLSIFVFNVVRGLGGEGLDALIWLRSDGTLAPVLLLGMCLPYNNRLAARINQLLFIAGYALILLFVLRMVIRPDLFMVVGGLEANEGRLLNMRGAILLAIAAGASLARFLNPRFGGPLDLVRTALFAGAEIVSGQGTATLCLATILALTWLLHRGLHAKSMIYSILLVSVGAIVTNAVHELRGVGYDSAYLSRRQINLENRQAIWQAALDEYLSRSTIDKVFGVPASVKPRIFPMMSFGILEWEKSLHSMYIGVLSRFGIVGLFFYLTIAVSTLFRLMVARIENFPPLHTIGLGIGLVVSSFLLGFTYELRNEGLLLLLIPLFVLNRGNTYSMLQPQMPNEPFAGQV